MEQGDLVNVSIHIYEVKVIDIAGGQLEAFFTTALAIVTLERIADFAVQ